ncbi:hypothetical protein KW803_01575 [Candidatus Saccharibacteria bacterium]|nr:hypothetical protein [Candidatus Saccharibacteria bacterium]
MATKIKKSPKSGSRFGWRGFAIVLLTFFGLVSLVGFTMAHWTERQLLTTDNYVKLVAPLPKNDQVATSLSDFAVNKLFAKIELEQKISEALPPKAAFLAPPLTDQLTTRTKAVAKNAIQSDRFQGIWTEANRAAQKRLVDKARGETPETNDKAGARFNLDLSGLGTTIRERLGNSSLPIFANQDQDSSNSTAKKIGIGVALKTSFDKFKKFVNVVDFANGILGVLALACILWAVAISRTRRRLLLIITTIVGVISLLQIIGVKAFRPYILDQVATQSYRPAVGVIYDDLVAAFQHSATILFVAVLLIFVVTFLWGYKRFTTNKYVAKYLKDIKKSSVHKYLRRGRSWVGLNRYYLMGAALIIVLIAMAAMSGYDWEAVIRAGIIVAILCAIIRLFSVLPSKTIRGKAPM